ncbi:MAG: ATP-binding protein, partial [Deltaproteobacteria bacterium]|nr:ATP-binding protein [Deltaproteobacteria bacterium]
WTVLIGPRQAGKTTLGKYLCQTLINQGRFRSLIYLNCDYFEVRNWLNQGPQFLNQVLDQFELVKPILFIDESQRLENPGLLLKAIVDLNRSIKLITSGSSQLEIKAKIQEHLTGRQLEALILPFSQLELKKSKIELAQQLIFGSYPQIVKVEQKEIILSQLFSNYISKDIIELLKLGKPDMMRNLIGLMAHSVGQLVNYQQLAVDCKSTIPTIQNYLSILEQTYVLKALKPFVGNKRTEITANPIYYFLDNGFRNQALQNFSLLERRSDAGFLVENFVLQEIMKYKTQHFKNWDIYFWRTKSGAEVDFVVKAGERIVPIEVKYQNMKAPKLTRGFRSFLKSYQPSLSAVITKSFTAKVNEENGTVMFLTLPELDKILTKI